MIVGFDFDGVLVDNTKRKKELFERLFNKDVPEDCLLREHIKQCGISPIDYDNTVSMLYSSNIVDNQDIHPDAKTVINKLGKHASILIISSRSQEEGFHARAFLEKNKIPFDAFICTNKEPKTSVIEKFDVSHYIDDDFIKLKQLDSTRAKLFLLSKPYNLKQNIPNTISRVESLKHFAKLITLR